MLSKGVGKGNKASLKRIRIENNQGEIETELQDRNSIEEAIIDHNKKHFRQAFGSVAYCDKIYDKLNVDDVRNKIFCRELTIDECDHEDIHSFLKLLAIPNNIGIDERREEITIDEWERVVKKSKQKSASSVFSNRIYSIYKCALDSEQMTRILVRFYNTLIRKRLYLKHWLKILDIILEKGKGPILGKLRIIQLYEADFQNLMRIYIGDRNEKNIEKDSRLSQFNYGSKKSYSIDEAILEKRLMYDTSVRDSKPMIHNISDLKACYDRQLSNIRYMMQESVGVQRYAIKVFQKVLPIMNYHICTDFGVSKNYYSYKREKLEGTGQGNLLSGAICRDTSYIIFKYLEGLNLGAIIEVIKSQKSLQRVAIAFVNDTDFYTNGPDFE